jgi:cardiolipin synthase
MAEVSVGLPVSRLAKWKTAVQMTAIGFLIVGDAGPGWLPVAWIGWVGLWAAAILTIVTGWDYLSAGLRHMLGRAPGAPLGDAKSAPVPR